MKPSDNSTRGAGVLLEVISTPHISFFFTLAFHIPTKLQPSFLSMHQWQPGPCAFQRQSTSTFAHHLQGGTTFFLLTFTFIYTVQLINGEKLLLLTFLLEPSGSLSVSSPLSSIAFCFPCLAFSNSFCHNSFSSLPLPVFSFSGLPSLVSTSLPLSHVQLLLF